MEAGPVRLGVAGAVVDGRLVTGDVEVTGGRVSAIGVMPPARRDLAVPGLVDLQVNGFAGVDFLAADADGHMKAGEALAATGVTAYQPTLISSPPDAYRRALGVADRLAAERAGRPGPRPLGVHLEGPFLAVERRGAHPREHIRPPDPRLLDELLGWGPVTTMTLAPELPGAIDLVARLTARGVVVSLGHSDATATEAAAGFNAGASTVTHLFNAMRPFDHREPGLAGAALARPGVVVQAIVDGVHLATDTVRLAWRAAAGRFALVTDAIEAAGCPDGEHRLGTREVDVRGMVARLADGTLAGSVLTMDAAVRNLVDLGVPVEAAIGAATEVPARILRRGDLGRISVGSPADLVVLDDALRPVRTLVGGVEIFAA
jgi:N-acetylglucosamine-6-phosphate deacetylase